MLVFNDVLLTNIEKMFTYYLVVDKTHCNFLDLCNSGRMSSTYYLSVGSGAKSPSLSNPTYESLRTPIWKKGFVMATRAYNIQVLVLGPSFENEFYCKTGLFFFFFFFFFKWSYWHPALFWIYLNKIFKNHIITCNTLWILKVTLIYWDLFLIV